MQRMGMLIGVKPDKINTYKQLHNNTWPEVLQQIQDSNIQNYSIFLRQPENLLFAYWEYHGKNITADLKQMAEHKKTREWWTHTDPCQSPLASFANSHHWATMEEVFHTE
ncbi:MAG: L-rhamnose mutarotase [Alphaproteobacteria bacterium]